MTEFLKDGLHLFVIVVIGCFVIFGTMALTGKFDHWNSRFIKKVQHIFSRIRRYFDRKRKREKTQQQNHFKDTRHDHQSLHETYTNDGEPIE